MHMHGVFFRSVFTLLLAALASRPPLLAQGAPTGVVGWYNGDRAVPGIAGWSNYYLSPADCARVYDDFVVPDGGWTVVGVFSNNRFYGASPVKQASWEIRTGMAPGFGGGVVASGISPATQVSNPTTNDDRIQVTGIQAQLPPGRYWLSVTPVGPAFTQSYLSVTTGAHAVGDPPGNNGGALFYRESVEQIYQPLDGLNLDLSQGILISPPPVSPATAWRANLAYLADQMPVMHSVPFPGVSLPDFNHRMEDLYAHIPSMPEAEIRTGLQALVASIEDPHTDVSWPSPGPFRFLPLSFYWFDDGIYVTDAALQYQNLLGARLVSVGKVGIDEATQRLTALVPHDNDQWVKHVIPGNKLTNTDFLFGTGIADNTDGVQVVAQAATGDVVTADVQAFGPAQSPRQVSVFQGDPPLYRQHTDRHYWATFLDAGATVYFQYNSCTEDPKQSSSDFLQQLDEMLAQDGVRRLIVDMRNNGGGLASILDPWIDKISTTRFNQPGRLYVIVGRATFSAAMEAANFFRSKTVATFVGEPTGAMPRFLLRRGDFPLPYYGIRVSYSRGNEAAIDDGPALVPDIQVGLTFQDYMHGADPAMDAILAIPLPE
jgi:hypothetical protein